MSLVMTQAEIDDDPARWHEQRQRGIGGSDIATIVRAEGAYSSPFALYWQKIDGGGIPDTLRMRRGRHDESLVAELLDEYPAIQPMTVLPGGLYRSDDRPWQQATFDRLTGYGAPIQIKTSNTRAGWGDAPDGEIPANYLAQILHEIDVAGADEGLLPCLFDGPDELRVYRVIIDADARKDVEFLRASGQQFWQRIIDRDPPDVDWHADTTAALKRIHARVEHRDARIPKSLARRLRRAYAARRAAERRFKQAENEVRELMGPATRAITRGSRGIDADHPNGLDYDVIATRSVYDERRVNLTDLRAARPALLAKFTQAKQIDKMLVKQPKPTTRGRA